MSSILFNRRWATVLLEALTRHGVRHVCIAPGSRSTPLTMAAAANSRLYTHTHFDERGLGHLALGMAKVTGEPIAVIVTSGTAVANLYPALIEVGLTGERLVLLTADRPPELIDCGANQAIRQQNMFASHPRETLNLPRPTPDIPAAWLVSSIDSAMARLDHGALHVNCPFAEPLYGDADDDGQQGWSAALGDWWQGERPWLEETAPYMAGVCTEADWAHWRSRRGVVLIGRVDAEAGRLAAAWGKTLGWPVLGDVLSQSGQPLPCADLWLSHPDARRLLGQAEIVVQFGASLTGKRALQWQAACKPQTYWLIDPLPGRLDPACHRGRRRVAPVQAWLQAHPAQPASPWAAGLGKLAERAAQCVAEEVQDTFGEAQVAHRLARLLPEQGQLFVGNSLIVRLIDALGQLPAGYPVYSNRGASGIDGLVSTIAGVQRGSGRPTLAILGDLSALYDVNGLALLRQVTAATVVIVVNNNGGQIFSMLPTPAAERERFYLMPQNVDFRHAAALFDLAYTCPGDWAGLSEAVRQGWQRQGTTLIELRVPGTAGAETLQRLLTRVAAL